MSKKFPQKRKIDSFITRTEQPEEPECLIIPGLGQGTGSTDLVLVPCGEVDGCILYVECRDPHVLEGFGQGQGQHLEE